MLGLRDLAGGPGPGFSCKISFKFPTSSIGAHSAACLCGRLEPTTTTNTRDLDLEFQWKRNEGTAPGNETKAI